MYTPPRHIDDETQGTATEWAAWTFWRAIDSRIEALRQEAKEEGLPFSGDSHEQACQFILSKTIEKMPYIFLHDDGCLRLIWKNDDEEQIGLKFLGDDRVLFVIFWLQHMPTHMNRCHGYCGIDSIHVLIDGARLNKLLIA